MPLPVSTRPAWACRGRSITSPRLRSSPQLPLAKRWLMMTAQRKRWPSLTATELSPSFQHHQHDEDDQRDRPRRRRLPRLPVRGSPSSPHLPPPLASRPPSSPLPTTHSRRPAQNLYRTPPHQHAKSSSPTAAERWSKTPAANTCTGAAPVRDAPHLNNASDLRESHAQVGC